MAFTVLLAAIAVVIGVWGIYTRSKLARLRAEADDAWQEIDAQLKRRWDLVPTLIEAVEAYAPHETAVSERVAAARARALEAATPPERAIAEQAVKDALFALFAIAEDHPEIRADERFETATRALEEAEDVLQRSRRVYNAAARELNAAVFRFPRSAVAGLFGFRPRRYFALPEEVEGIRLGVRF